MKRRISFLTAASPETGLGHLYRCDALSTALRSQGGDCHISIASHSGHAWIEKRAPETEWNIYDWNHSPVRTEEAIQDAETVIVDCYDIDITVLHYLQERFPSPVFFDDCGSIIPERGVVINGSPGATRIPYPDRENVRYLLGTDYQVLRSPFWQHANRKVIDSVQSIGVMLGGTDHRGLMNSILSAVRAVVSDKIKVYAIGLQSVPAGLSGIYATGHLSATDMKSLLDSLDILISAAGQSVAEAVSCFLPTIMIQTAENQSLNVIGWQNYDCCVFAGSADDMDILSNIQHKVLEMLDVSRRRACVSAARMLQIADSSTRLAAAIMNSIND